MKRIQIGSFEDSHLAAHRGTRIRAEDFPHSTFGLLPMKHARTRERTHDEVMQAAVFIPKVGRPESLKRRM
jgi:hypothetical protein